MSTLHPVIDHHLSWAAGSTPRPVLLTGTLVATAIGLGLAYCLITVIYNLYFHPLRHFPGPKLNAACIFPHMLAILRGKYPQTLYELSLQYGYYIRVAPNTISIVHPCGIPDIRGHRKHGKEENIRDPNLLYAFKDSMANAPRHEHTRLRRILSSGFSNQAMVNQEPIFRVYVDKLIQRLRQASHNGTVAVDLTKWYAWTTFDVIGDLAFGEPFGCLDNEKYHPWVSDMINLSKESIFTVQMLRFGPFLGPLLSKLLTPRELAGKIQYHKELSMDKVHRRLKSDNKRSDYITALIESRNDEGEPLRFNQLAENASVFTFAGSETTATALAAMTYFMTMSPHILAKTTEEVRNAFADEQAIGFLTKEHLPYLDAVINEALRLFPPAANPAARVINKQGDSTVDVYLPPGTRVESPLWAVHRHPDFFHRADEFLPERWLGDERFKNDRLDAVTPFGGGPRICLGKNLSYMELRMIMARMLWNFDMVLAEDSKDWVACCRSYIIWDKGSLNVHLFPRNTAAV